MKHRKTLYTGLCALLALSLSASDGRAEVEITTPYEGITLTRRVATVPRPLNLWIAEIDLNAPGIGFLVTPSNGPAPGENTRVATGAFMTAYDLELAINASFYTVDAAGGLAGNNRGLVASQGDVYSPFETDTRPWPAFNLSETNTPSIVDRVNPGVIDTAIQPAIDLYNAVSGSERIVTNGLNTAGQVTFGQPTLLHPRTAIGYTDDQRLVMIVADGRSTASGGMTSLEMADLMISYGVTDAVNLDGGGSSTMTLRQGSTAQVLNTPSDGGQRLVATHLGVDAQPAQTQTSLLTYADFYAGDLHAFHGDLTASPDTRGLRFGRTGDSRLEALQGDSPDGPGWIGRLTLLDNPAEDDGWVASVHHEKLAEQGGGQRGGGALVDVTPVRPTTGTLGFWARTSDENLLAQLLIESGGQTLSATSLPLIADGDWHFYTWGLQDVKSWPDLPSGETFRLRALQVVGPDADAVVDIDGIRTTRSARCPSLPR
jgi:hypothetical protein